MSAGPPKPSARRIDEACDRYEAAWRAGEEPRVEDFLGDAAREDRPRLFRELLAIDLELRSASPPSLAGYEARFPDRLDDVRDAWNEHHAPRSQAPPVEPSATRSHRPTAAPPRTAPGSAGASRYRIVREHARGGLGEVFVARDEELLREVALKQIQPLHADDPDKRSRFLAEAEITGALEHPGVVPVYGLGRYADGRPYYAMRLVRGESLRDALRRFHGEGEGPREPGERTLAFRALLGRFVGVCNAVAYAHSRGVIHRDLKPANVMLGPFGETLVVDWGLAKTLGAPAERPAPGGRPVDHDARPLSAPTQDGDVLGTPAYMSPEQATGRPDDVGPASDVYSLGATLYAVLTGAAPFTGRDLPRLLEHVRRGEFTPPRGVNRATPKALEAVCLKAMARDPADRYATPLALAADVEHWLADEPVAAWREPWTTRARRRVSRHRVAASATAAGLLVLLLAGAAALAGRRARGVELVPELVNAAIENVPAVVKQLDGYRWWVDPRLAEVARRAPDRSDARLRAALGMLPVDPGQAAYLREQMLRLPARELLVVREALAAARPAPENDAPLWQALAPEGLGGSKDRSVRFRAACGLARSAGDPRWDRRGLADEAVELLLEENRRDPVGIRGWADALDPLMPRLVAGLSRAYARAETSDADRGLVVSLLRDHARGPADLAELVRTAASPADFEAFFSLLARSREGAVPLLKNAATAPAPDGPPEARDREAARQARAAVALARLGETAAVWPMLRHSPDPSRRSHLVEALGTFGVDPGLVVARLTGEADVSARRALILALGQYDPDRLDARDRETVAVFLARDDADAGVHSAADWLLRRWSIALPSRAVPGGPVPGRSWFVNAQGQTYAVLGTPAAFTMGSPPDEPGREPDEVRHRRRIDRVVALATREVTVAEFAEFEASFLPETLPRHDEQEEARKTYSPEPRCPMCATDWYIALLYCRWLSEKDGVPEPQMCYPGRPELMAAYRSRAYPSLPPDLLSRTGYRLPTEAEWEFACRAGAETQYPFGSGDSLLPRYGWTAPHAEDHSYPVGLLKPNDFGLFDTLGNLKEWCQYPYAPYPEGGERPAADVEPTGVPDGEDTPTRGGFFRDPPSLARSAHRHVLPYSNRVVSSGLRPARTLSSSPTSERNAANPQGDP